MTVALDVSDNVARITLAGPEDGNKVGLDMAFAVAERADEVRQRDDVWVVVLCADGPDFCTGTAPQALDALAANEVRIELLAVGRMIAGVEKPVVCALSGAAHEQGLEIALACDLRIADSTATFRLNQAVTGSMPWDGGTQRLPRLIGRSRAVEMLLTGRQLDAQQALEYGLVNEVTQDAGSVDRAVELAQTIAAHGPIALRYLKEAVRSGMDLSLDQGLRLEADLSFLLQSTDDRAEGIASFLQRRGPNYRGA